MARRKRPEVVITDNVTIINLGQTNKKRSKPARKRPRRVYELVPKYGRADVPVGRGTKGIYRKAPVQPLATTAAKVIE